MLSEVCRYLRNWFEVEKRFGTFNIHDGEITDENGSAVSFLNGQHFRIIGSILNDGVYAYPPANAVLTDETFEGAVWGMAVPKEVVDISNEIDEWITAYGGAQSAANSPYSSESFAGYSYSKSSGGGSDGTSGGSPGDWRSIYGSRLNAWRKI